MTRVLLVDADKSRKVVVRRALERCGHSVCGAPTGFDALAAHPAADVVVLSVELPDLDGIEVCRRIRDHSSVPLIGILRDSTELNRVLALRSGLDMILEYPFGITELLARVAAVTRRLGARPRTRRSLSFGSLEIDEQAREVRVGDRSIRLTHKEFDLLHLLASNPGRTVDRRKILAEVWKDDKAWMTGSRTIDTHVHSIRRKLGSGSAIRTHRGVGFRFTLS